MKKIMTMVIEKREQQVASVKKRNQIASPVCSQVGKKVLKNRAAQLKPNLPHMNVQSKSVQEVNGRKRNSTQAQSVKRGENLVGRKIKVLWPANNPTVYYGVVKSFDYSTKKHKVCYDHGDSELLDLHLMQQWELLENVAPISNCLGEAGPKEVSSPQFGIVCVQGYKVKNNNAPILEAIFKKHGDIAADCIVKSVSVRESILEVVCEVIKQIQTNDVATIISKMTEIQSQVSDAEATKLNVSWLRAHLEAIHKMTEAKKNCRLLKEVKAKTSLVKSAAKMDLKHRRIELLTAQERFEKAERCMKVLDLVEEKLNNNILESGSENDSWVNQPL